MIRRDAVVLTEMEHSQLIREIVGAADCPGSMVLFAFAAASAAEKASACFVVLGV